MKLEIIVFQNASTITTNTIWYCFAVQQQIICDIDIKVKILPIEVIMYIIWSFQLMLTKSTKMRNGIFLIYIIYLLWFVLVIDKLSQTDILNSYCCQCLRRAKYLPKLKKKNIFQSFRIKSNYKSIWYPCSYLDNRYQMFCLNWCNISFSKIFIFIFSNEWRSKLYCFQV